MFVDRYNAYNIFENKSRLKCSLRILNYVLICSLKSGTTEPDEANTLPNLTIVKFEAFEFSLYACTINSENLLNRIENNNKCLITKSNLPKYLSKSSSDILVIMGAGDISEEVNSIKKHIELL